MELSTHHLPLPTLAPPRPPPAAVIRGTYVQTDRPNRYGAVRRARRDLPRLFGAALVPSIYSPRILPLDCRQPAGGAQPRYEPPSHSLKRSSKEDGEGRDLYDVLYEAYCGSRLLASRLASRVTRSQPDVGPDPNPVPSELDEAHYPLEKPDAWKHANASNIQISQLPDVSVQYEALAPDISAGTVQYEVLGASQCYSVPYGARYVTRRGAARAQRAAVRCVLAASGALYALAFIAFYFLSL